VPSFWNASPFGGGAFPFGGAGGGVKVIIGIVGYPVAGKSYLAAQMLLSRRFKGRRLFSNIPVEGANKVTLTDLIQCAIPHGSVVLLDEVQGIAPARSTLHGVDMWASIPYEVYSYFAEGRKYGVDWLWTCQDGSRADKVLRELTQEWIECEKVLGPLHRATWYGSMMTQTMQMRPIKREWFWIRRRGYLRYNSYYAVLRTRPPVEKQWEKWSAQEINPPDLPAPGRASH